MNTTQDLFLRTHFVMNQTTHGGNIGSAARALKTMGFSNLTISNSKLKEIHSNKDAIAMASNAQDTLSAVKVKDNLNEALSDINMAFALTARARRDFESIDVRQMATVALNHLIESKNHNIAIVMGNEQSGLDNNSLYNFNYIVSIPANPEYSSLNVAQALQITAWELRYKYINQLNNINFDVNAIKDSATIGQCDYLIKTIIEKLESSGYDKDKLNSIELKTKHLLRKSQISKEDVQMFLGIIKHLEKPRG
ncbi:RNA methyltransferase [Taylorella equigenitalis]|uniref:RNA methyltransferase n=1 Tax=Taylorella equigenitalis TaxID=29575 RepID=UPI00237CF25F|nr:RNA methyltransferase [Taylorella equigenitalis]WDU55384.1 RNA methyltransferase [Taylorella equigenitalis]